MNKKSVALLILKSAEKIKHKLIIKRQYAYFKPLKAQNKPWSNEAFKYTIELIYALKSTMDSYKNDCINLIVKNKKLFKIQKARSYRTNEYLDSLYNHVIVPDIEDKLLMLNGSFEKELSKLYEKYITNGLVRDSAELVFKDMKMDFDFNKFNENARNYLRDKKINWSKKVSKSTEESIKRQLVKGYEQGLSTYDIAENLQKETGFSYNRCEAIARTEIISSCNYVDNTAFNQNSDVIGREWSSTGDRRTRPTHQDANGQKRKNDEPFIVGDSKLMYPGDSSLNAESKEIIMCRCTIYPVFKGESLVSNTPYDEKDVGSPNWIARRDENFQINYLGGRGKFYLFKNNFLDPKEYKTPWKKIKNDILLRAGMNFKKVKPTDILDKLGNVVLAEILRVLTKGLLTNKEHLGVLSAVSGAKLFKNVKGHNSSIDAEKNIVDFIDKQGENTLILMHNHPPGGFFSPSDLVTFLRYKSIKYLFAIGHNGKVYILEKTHNTFKLGFSSDEWRKYTNEIDNYVHDFIQNHKINDTTEEFYLQAGEAMKDVCRLHGINYYSN